MIGERRAIEIIRGRLSKMKDAPIPFGDDVSAFSISKNELVVLKTDMLVRETDVPPGMSCYQAARKAIVMNVSDFAAKGVKPTAALVALGLPRELTIKEVEDIGAGLNDGAREYGAYVLGGDTGEARDLIISVSLSGTAKKDRVMLRSGAKPGDLVAVTGTFGKTVAGLELLCGGFKSPLSIREVLVDSVLTPHARLKEGLALSQTGAVTAAIDSSDGLAWSLHEIASASNVGFLLDELPIAKEVQKFAEINAVDPVGLTLYGGEEYELVLTLKPTHVEQAERAVEKVGGKLSVIGRVAAQKKAVLKTGDIRRVIEPRGYEHFKEIQNVGHDFSN
jgi:thiamine-monophosphate kinase